LIIYAAERGNIMLSLTVTPRKLGNDHFCYVIEPHLAPIIERELRQRGFTVRNRATRFGGWNAWREIEARKVRHSEPFSKRNRDRRSERKFKLGMQEACFA
jgi:hypothetical protein